MQFRSNEEFLLALKNLSQEAKPQLDWSDFKFIFKKSDLNTISFREPLAKAYFLYGIVSTKLKDNGSVIYIDLDTTFTAYLEHGIFKTPLTEGLFIYNPEGEDLDDVMAQVSALMSQRIGLVVLDSVSMLYHLFRGKLSPAELNRKMGVYLALLKALALRLRIPVLITSMLRARKTVKSGIISWNQAPAGGRILRQKSATIISLSRAGDYLEVQLVKHGNDLLQNRSFKAKLIY